MQDPTNYDPNSGSYVDLLNRITQRMQRNQIDHQILTIFKQVFIQELNKENLFLTRPERERLFRQVTKSILIDMLENIDSSK